jgi:hypothetical protein
MRGVNGGGKTAGIEAPTRSRKGNPFLIASQNRVGRVIRAVKREFIVKGEFIRTRDVLLRAYPRLKRFTAWHYLAARRALRKEATIVARCRFGSGRPALWAPIAPTRP